MIVTLKRNTPHVAPTSLKKQFYDDWRSEAIRGHKLEADCYRTKSKKSYQFVFGKQGNVDCSKKMMHKCSYIFLLLILKCLRPKPIHMYPKCEFRM